MLNLLCAVAEYDEMPVRHNEDKLNLTLSNAVRYAIDRHTADDPHTKTNLLLQVIPPSFPWDSFWCRASDLCYSHSIAAEYVCKNQSKTCMGHGFPPAPPSKVAVKRACLAFVSNRIRRDAMTGHHQGLSLTAD